MIRREMLDGLPIDEADRFGKPCVGSRYVSGDRYERLSARCRCCGIVPATNVHHIARRARRFHMRLADGRWVVLKPSLIALCGSGTTGCHGAVHAHDIEITWVWDSEELREDWFSGRMLMEQGMEPYSPRLYAYGSWMIRNLRTHGIRFIREA